MMHSLRVVAKYLGKLGNYAAGTAGDLAVIRRLAEDHSVKLAEFEKKLDQIVQALGPHIDEQRAFRSHVEDSIDRHGKRLRALENGKRVNEAR